MCTLQLARGSHSLVISWVRSHLIFMSFWMLLECLMQQWKLASNPSNARYFPMTSKIWYEWKSVMRWGMHFAGLVDESKDVIQVAVVEGIRSQWQRKCMKNEVARNVKIFQLATVSPKTVDCLYICAGEYIPPQFQRVVCTIFSFCCGGPTRKNTLRQHGWPENTLKSVSIAPYTSLLYTHSLYWPWPVIMESALPGSLATARRRRTGIYYHQHSGVTIRLEAIQRCMYRLVQTDMHVSDTSCHSEHSFSCLHWGTAVETLEPVTWHWWL